MSLARACVRLSAVAALRGKTLAEMRVFDSRMDAIDGLKPDERKPVIAVFTEEQEGEALANDRGPPFRPWVDLVFEIAMVEAQYSEADEEIVVSCPTTDDELEMALDVIEQQIRFSLFEDLTSNLAALFRTSILGARHYKSMRYRDEVKSNRIAYRYIVVQVEVADEVTCEVFDPTLVGLDRLPETFRRIAKAWPDGLEEKNKALAIADAFAQPTKPGALAFTAKVQPGRDPRTRIAFNVLRPS